MEKKKNAEYVALKLADKLNNNEPYFEIQNWIKNLPEMNSELWSAVRNLVKTKVPKERIIEHDTEGLLEEFSFLNYQPKPDSEFQNMLQSIRSELKEESFYDALITKMRK